jgi:parallel beta-helix repeat protein
VPAYYVSPDGSDSGTGTASDPFATLGRAQQAMEDSSIHTTYVEGGTYNLSSSLNLTSADDGMSFIAASGDTPVLNGGGWLSNIITLNGAENVTIQGLTFENTAIGDGNGAVSLIDSSNNDIVGNLFQNNDRGVLLTGSDYNTVSGNEMDNSTTAGINAGAGSDHNTFDSNIINGVSIASGSDTSSGGIFITGGDYNSITHNLIENTAAPGINLNNWVSDASDTTNLDIGNTISYNSVIDANDSSSDTDSGAIYIDGRAGVDTQTTINNNYVNNASSPSDGLNVGIYLDDFTSGVTVTNNITTGGNFAFLIHGGENDTLSNNVFDLGTTAASNLGGGLIQSEGGGPISQMTGDSVTGNIFYSTASSSPNAYIVYGGSASVSGNLYYNTNGQSFNTQGMDNSASYGDPDFTDPSTGDFTLGSGSAASSIGFQNIDQSTIGLAPTTAHWG